MQNFGYFQFSGVRVRWDESYVLGCYLGIKSEWKGEFKNIPDVA